MRKQEETNTLTKEKENNIISIERKEGERNGKR
jgi:hypothetical protein